MRYAKKLLRTQMSLFKPIIEKSSLSAVRKGQDAIGALLASFQKSEVEYEDIRVAEMECSMITPIDELSAGVILYLHGGGYICGNLAYAKGFGSVLAAKCGIKVFCCAYRLAPEHPFPTALEDCLDAYGHLLSSGYLPSQIIVCGESAGGGLCYALCDKLKEKGRSLPAGVIAISPWTDLTQSGKSYVDNLKIDVSMTPERLKYFADCYVYGSVNDGKNVFPRVNEDADNDRIVKSNPRISPLFAELNGMPPSLIFVGSDEIMLDDAVRMHERLLEFGAQSELVVAPGMWHGYVLYCLKEFDSDFDKISDFIKRNISSQKKLRWLALDNAAKIFPASMSRNWTNLFRLSATLEEEIDVSVLKIALDVTVRRFPSIAVRVRRGLFWYYLEEVPRAPEILEEKPYPLSRMPFDDISKCAFRVIAYEKRIAVEFFHALTDGNGGLVFLKTLVSEYLYQKHGVKVPVGNGVLDRLEKPNDYELEDSFPKYAGPTPASRADSDSFRIKGKREVDGFRTNTSFILDAETVKNEAKKRGVTVTAYLTSVLMCAAVRVQEKRVLNKKRYLPVKVCVPVNLRNIFPSRTLRNFVLYATPGIDPRLGEYGFDEICEIVHHQMKLQITEKNMAAMIATNVNSEKPLAMKLVPLFIKDIVMKMIFNAVGERKSCFSFSNLGLVNMPEEFMRYVDRLDFVLGSQSSAPYNTSAITYNGRLVLNIIRNIAEPVLEYEIYHVLRELGIMPTAESNTRGKE